MAGLDWACHLLCPHNLGQACQYDKQTHFMDEINDGADDHLAEVRMLRLESLHDDTDSFHLKLMHAAERPP